VGGVGEGVIGAQKDMRDKDDVGKKIKKKVKAKKETRKGIMGISSFHPHYTVRRSHFAKRFLKTALAPPEEPKPETFWVEPEPSQTGPPSWRLANGSVGSRDRDSVSSQSVWCAVWMPFRRWQSHCPLSVADRPLFISAAETTPRLPL
jgi:hypothetical protein